MKVILIGGSSHVGKSTLARSLAGRLGWTAWSTDRLARHPGRPWNHATGVVKEHVARHYATLPVEELLADVLAHYRRNVLPQVREIVAEQVAAGTTAGLVLEGSALWPEDVAQLDLNRVGAVWLTASDALLQDRMYAESRYENATAEGRFLIDQFLARTQLYNRRMRESVARLGLPNLEVRPTDTVEDLSHRCLAMLPPVGR